MKMPIQPPSVGVGAPKVLELDPTKPPPHVIERAYQLAKSGKFASVEEICQQLSREGYRELYLDFEGLALRTDLARKCHEAQGRPAPGQRIPPRRAPVSKAKRFETKAAECRQLADNPQHAGTRKIYLRLALSYEQLADNASHNERVDEQQKSFRRQA
jgi:hypothetical protein